MPRTVSFTAAEHALLIEALARAATRHESMAKAYPRSARPHELTAAAMRKLRAKLEDVPALGSVVQEGVQ